MIGPSVAGNRRILRCIADLVHISDGSISVLGLPTTGREGRDFAFVFQEATLLPWRTRLKTSGFRWKSASVTKLGYAEPEKLLALVGLKGRENACRTSFPAGRGQRVAIATRAGDTFHASC